MLVLVRTGACSSFPARLRSRAPAVVAQYVAIPQGTQQSGTAVTASWSRHFAGRASRGGAPEEEAASEAEVAASTTTSGSSSSSSSSSSAAAPESSSGGASSSSSSASSTGSSSSSGQPKSGNSGDPASLFALPLYRKPAFPGFYQIIQVSEQEVLDFLFDLRKGGKGEQQLAGFMTKELPAKLKDEAEPSPITMPGPGGSDKGNAANAQHQGLRRDAGRVNAADELEEVGSSLQVVNLTQYPNISGGQVVVMPQRRIRRVETLSEPGETGATPIRPLASLAIEPIIEPPVAHGDSDLKALHMEIFATMRQLLKTSFLYKEQFEQVIRFYNLDDPAKLADLVAGMSLADRQEQQAVLAETDLHERLRKVLTMVKKDLELARLQSQVKSQVEEKVSKEQRKMMLMEQMRHIKKELGMGKDDKQSLIDGFREAIKEKTIPEEANKVIETEIGKLNGLEPSSSEYNVCRTYLEWLTCLPWGHLQPENKDIEVAEKILNEDHYGLEDVKERILEHMAVSFLKESVQGKIMCLVGPPGVGKTSIGKSIARSLDRKFYRFSVGGMHDVAELRGHRRTYVGAMPGKMIQCFKNTQVSNPVVLIDEIDKLGRDHRGDPSSAFLEILDPEQNNAFRDHYLDVPVDLSRVLFVCTANTTDSIPGPLLDRMEVIRIAGYVFEEKVAIANQYLIPQTAETHGIGEDVLKMTDEALSKMIGDYARESGVRHLRQLLEKVNRKVALGLVRKKEEKTEDGAAQQQQKVEITVDNLTKYIGQPLHMSERLYANGITPPGVVTGLAWTSMGGATLFVEARGRLPRGGGSRGGLPMLGCTNTPQFPLEEKPAAEDSEGGGRMTGVMKVTGQLGSVMNESSSISLTYARVFVREFDPSNTFLDEAHLHLNVPEGATPKDGPSAGVTMASALVSLAVNKPLKQDLAMTGELTLTGKVLKVGGIKEKVLAARREHIKTLILPKHNEADYSELKDYLRAGITAHFVDHFDDVYRLAFDQEQVISLPFESRGMPVVSVTTPLAPSPGEGPRPLSDDASFEQMPTGSTGELPGSEPSRPPAEASDSSKK